MFEEFKKFLTDKRLIESSDKLLIAVSGGIDSVVLLHLISKLKNYFAIAHCNFQLRGNESDEDHQFVKELSRNYNCDFYDKRFETLSLSKKLGESIQMTARNLRYEWFSHLAKEHCFTKIVIAHNKNDIAETILLNLSRGTGIKGLTGIAVQNNTIIRPLLFASREEIKKYAIENGIVYREDSSNSDTKYRRNKIRHEIIPLFEEMNPSFLESVIKTSEILKSTEEIFSQNVRELKNQLIKFENNKWIINNEDIHELSVAVLFEILNEFGFSFDTIVNLKEQINTQSGKKFSSDKYLMIIDRNQIEISEIVDEDTRIFNIEKDLVTSHLPIDLSISAANYSSGIKIPASRSTAFLDFDKIQFPIVLRKWIAGDYFIPLGMKGKKKLSDFFIDKKLSIIEKQKIWILTSNEKIIWVVGMQIDNRYKITSKTSKALRIVLE